MRRKPLIPYFAYGSNLDPIGMQRRCPYAQRGRAARLDDWVLEFAGVADISQTDLGLHVDGAIWYVTAEDIVKLDRYEGYPHLYLRRWVDVDGERCLVYEMRNKNPMMLPSPYYYDTIVRGFRFWGLPMTTLEDALNTAEEDCFQRGIKEFEPDGPKRLKPATVTITNGMSPATIAELGLRSEPEDEGICDELDEWE